MIVIMSTAILAGLWEKVSQLDPSPIRRAAGRPLRIRLHATTSASYAQMEDFFAPRGLSRDKRLELMAALERADEPHPPAPAGLEIFEEGMPLPPQGFYFYPRSPGQTVAQILERQEMFGLPLARLFPPFRAAVSRRLIHTIARENAVFALASCLPELVPHLVPGSVDKLAPETAVLTANQIRLALLLAAASDRPPGYREQKAEIAALVAGAFFWRALARKLVEKVPYASGALPKAGIAFAATQIAGWSLERLYRTGHLFSRHERRLAYDHAYEEGVRMAGGILEQHNAGAQP